MNPLEARQYHASHQKPQSAEHWPCQESTSHRPTAPPRRTVRHTAPQSADFKNQCQKFRASFFPFSLSMNNAFFNILETSFHAVYEVPWGPGPKSFVFENGERRSKCKKLVLALDLGCGSSLFVSVGRAAMIGRTYPPRMLPSVDSAVLDLGIACWWCPGSLLGCALLLLSAYRVI